MKKSVIVMTSHSCKGKTIWKRLLACDFETYHIKDFEADNVKLMRDGNRLVADGDNVPETSVKCAGVVEYNLTDTYRDNMIRKINDTPVCKICYDNLEDFLCMLCHMKNTVVFFHNLTYDEFFIADPILRNGGKLKLKNGYIVSNVRRQINKQGKVLYAKYRFRKHSGTKNTDDETIVEFRDSLQIFHSKLEAIGKMVGIMKGHEALRAGVDQVLMDYCITDCEICGKAMIYYWNMCRNKTHNQVKFGWMTSASTAYNLWKKFAMSRLNMTAKEYNEKFTMEGAPDWLRWCYKGASPLLDPNVVWEILEDILVFDVNSMYPFMMATQWLPIGKGEPISEDELRQCDFKLKGAVWCAKVRMHIQIKEGKRACYLVKDCTDDGVLKTSVRDDEVHYITNVDYQLIKENYDIYYFEIEEAVKYNAVRGLPSKFINEWYTIKREAGIKGDTALKVFAKLVINSFYGKFGSNTVFDEYDYAYNETTDRINVVHTGVNQTKTVFYLPWAVWTTSYARLLITRGINALGWENVCYTDTDSLHVYNLSAEECVKRLKSVGINVGPEKLGDFKLETKHRINGVYIKNKWYVHAYAEDGDGYKKGDIEEFKSAGANVHNIKRIEEVTRLMDVRQSRAFKVKGGKVIYDSPIDMTRDDKKIKFRLGCRTEDESYQYAKFKMDKLMDKYVYNGEVHEDTYAYLKDCRYDEHDKYWKKHANRAMAQKLMDDYKTGVI